MEPIYPHPPGYFRLYDSGASRDGGGSANRPKWLPLSPPQPVWDEPICVFGVERVFSMAKQPPLLPRHALHEARLIWSPAIPSSPSANDTSQTSDVSVNQDELPILNAPCEFKGQLKALNKSLLLSFLQLLDFLLHQPGRLDEKVLDLRSICANMHLLVNAHRPAAARQHLAATLRAQQAERRQLWQHLRENVARVSADLRDHLQLIHALFLSSPHPSNPLLLNNHHNNNYSLLDNHNNNSLLDDHNNNNNNNNSLLDNDNNTTLEDDCPVIKQEPTALRSIPSASPGSDLSALLSHQELSYQVAVEDQFDHLLQTIFSSTTNITDNNTMTTTTTTTISTDNIPTTHTSRSISKSTQKRIRR